MYKVCLDDWGEPERAPHYRYVIMYKVCLDDINVELGMSSVGSSNWSSVNGISLGIYMCVGYVAMKFISSTQYMLLYFSHNIYR